MITAIAAGLALLLTTQETPIYRSTASVLVIPPDLGSSSQTTPTAPNMATEQQLVSSTAVAQLVVTNLKLNGSPNALLGNLSVGNPTDTAILQISYSDPNPARAETLANGFANGYLDYRKNSVTGQLALQAQSAGDQLKLLRQELASIDARLASLSSSDARVQELSSQASLLQNLILQQEINRLQVPSLISVGSVVQPASLPGSPASPNRAVNVGFGLAAGLALGIGLSFLRDRASGRLRSTSDLETNLGAPVLGSIPRVSAWRRRKEAFLVTRSERPSPAAEAYRTLRTNILSVAGAGDLKTILVTSARSGEGKTSTVANLGVVLSRAGKRVTLVSADLRRPRLHEFFGLPSSNGLADVLLGKIPLEKALREVTLQRSTAKDMSTLSLRVLPSGTASQTPAELLGTEAMANVLRSLEEISDIVLVDSAPLLPVADAAVLAPIAQGVLVVVGPQSATQATASSIREQLERVNARLFGAVLNGPDPRIAQSYYPY